MKTNKNIYSSETEYEKDYKYVLVYSWYNDWYKTKKQAKRAVENLGIENYQILTSKQFEKRSE